MGEAVAVRKRPFGVSLVVVLADIGAIFAVIGGIIALVGAVAAAKENAAAGVVVALLGGFLLVWGLAILIVGHFLWKGANWARLVFLVLNVIGVLLQIIGLTKGLNPVGLLQIVLGVLIIIILNGKAAKDYCA